jgi:formylglycine-generating enzyme required for sulfatase activity
MTLDWVEIPAGTFLMGLSDEQAREMTRQMPWLTPAALEVGLAAETPQRAVYVPTFYISRFPVTCGQFVAFVRSGYPEFDIPSSQDAELLNHPESCLWHYARAFCAWIGARLPSSGEWEKAARGTDGRLYPWGNEWDLNRGNFGQQDRRGRIEGWKTSPVDAYPEGASPYGIYDMVGNCFEWTMTHGLSYNTKRYSQVIIIRGSDPDPESLHPWAHRVTRIMPGGVLPIDVPPYTGFRPVLDEWQRQHWPGYRVEAGAEEGRAPHDTKDHKCEAP